MIKSTTSAEPPVLSLVMPSNRVGLGAYARILDACSCAAGDIEVVIRDNSGSAEKERLLSLVDNPRCHLRFVPPCLARENFQKALDLASGEFVFLVADDDYCNRRSFTSIANFAAQHKAEHSIAGISGKYLIEKAQGLEVFAYQPLNSTSTIDRGRNYLHSPNLNVLPYSAIRRSLVISVCDYVNSVPFLFSYTDQLMSILYLLYGRFVDANCIVYNYDLHEWEHDKALAKDIKYYTDAGFHESTVRLHWLLCAFEGVKAILTAPIGSALRSDRQAIAAIWFDVMINRLRQSQHRYAPLDNSTIDAEAISLCNKWTSTSNISLDAMLADICGFFSLSSPEAAFKFFNFWQ